MGNSEGWKNMAADLAEVEQSPSPVRVGVAQARLAYSRHDPLPIDLNMGRRKSEAMTYWLKILNSNLKEIQRF